MPVLELATVVKHGGGQYEAPLELVERDDGLRYVTRTGNDDVTTTSTVITEAVPGGVCVRVSTLTRTRELAWYERAALALSRRRLEREARTELEVGIDALRAYLEATASADGAVPGS